MDSEQTSPQAEVYGKAACPYTRAVIRKLRRDGTKLVDYDVERDPVALRRMLELNGGRRLVPTIVIGGEVSVGFHGT